MTHNFENGILTLTREDGSFVKFAYNPETQTPFASEEEALAYANSATLYFSMPEVEAPIAVKTKVGAIEYKLLFTAQERLAIKTSTDPIIQDLYEITNDTRLTEIDLSLKSTKEAIAYLVSVDVLTQERADQILRGEPA